MANGPTPSGALVVGATSPTLRLVGVTLADNGSSIDCVVTWACGSVYSRPAGLAVEYDCQADFNFDGGVDGADIESFFLRWTNGC